MHLVYGVDKENDLSMGSITVVENKVEQANLPDMFKCTTYVVIMFHLPSVISLMLNSWSREPCSPLIMCESVWETNFKCCSFPRRLLLLYTKYGGRAEKNLEFVEVKTAVANGSKYIEKM